MVVRLLGFWRVIFGFRIETRMRRVLIVDDDPLIREFMSYVLAEDGFDVYSTECGNKAVRLIEGMSPGDLVVTDILMPDGDGIEVLRGAERSAARPKVLAISGGGVISSAEYLESAGMLGADGVLPKPFSSLSLLKKVHEIVGRD